MSKWLNDFSIKYKFEHLMSETDAMTLDAIIGVIDQMPEHLIRCKDCKYWHDDGIMTTCDMTIGNGFMPDYFCSYGERKETE